MEKRLKVSLERLLVSGLITFGSSAIVTMASISIGAPKNLLDLKMWFYALAFAGITGGLAGLANMVKKYVEWDFVREAKENIVEEAIGQLPLSTQETQTPQSNVEHEA